MELGSPCCFLKRGCSSAATPEQCKPSRMIEVALVIKIASLLETDLISVIIINVRYVCVLHREETRSSMSVPFLSTIPQIENKHFANHTEPVAPPRSPKHGSLEDSLTMDGNATLLKVHTSRPWKPDKRDALQIHVRSF